MNAINKLGQKSGKHAAGGAKGESGQGESGGSSTPRYAPAPEGSSGGATGVAGEAFGQTINAASEKGEKSAWNGAKTLAGHYINRGNLIKGAKGLGRITRKGLVGAAGAATLGTVGLAAGIATGDASNALTYGLTGAGVGYAGANALGDKAAAFEKKSREIYKEGALGTEEYNTRGAIGELTKDNDFNNVCKQMGVEDQAGREALIRQYYSNGIKSAAEIKKSMIIRAKTGASQSEIIAAQKIKKRADQDGLKRDNIEKRLKRQGVTGAELKKAMSIIDML